MSTTVTELIALSKSYVHDDHAQVQGWISDDLWLTWLNIEYKQLYRRLIRDSVVDPAIDGETIAVPSENIPTAEAIVMVTEVTGTTQRVLKNVQSALGRAHLALSGEPGDAIRWTATASPEVAGITVALNPPPTTGVYTAYFIPSPLALVVSGAVAGESMSTLYLLAGAEDRLCLGAARRAMVRARGSNKELNQLLREADEELAFAAAGRLTQDGPRVRNVDWLHRGWPMRGQDVDAAVSDPNKWYWR